LKAGNFFAAASVGIQTQPKILELPKEGSLEMNYNSFFGFSDSPFLDDLDQRFLFLSKQFEQYLSELTDFVSHGQGLAVISGEEGVGKTMLIQALLQELPPSSQPVSVTGPTSEPLAITHMLAQSLGLTLRHQNLANLSPLAEALHSAAQQGKYYLLILDDAHLLTDQHLEEVYDLARMEHQGRRLLPVILAGRKGLVPKLASKTNQRLQKLIRHNLVLSRLSFEETTRYIDHRLQQVGSNFKASFAEGCSGQLFTRTGGIPRHINRVCDQALNRARQINQNRVTRDLIGGEEPVSVSQYKPLVPPPRYGSLTRSGAWAAAVLVTVLVVYLVYNNYSNPLPPATSSPAADSAALRTKAVPVPRQEQPSPSPETLPQVQSPDQAEVTPAQEEATPPEPQGSREPEPPQVLPRAESPPVPEPGPQAAEPERQVPEPETQATEPEATPSRPDTHRVASQTGGLLKIAAGYYPDEQDIGYDAIILANPQIDNEDIIYPGQQLSLPEVDKNNHVITLKNNQHYSIYKIYSSPSQVEQATARLQEREIDYVVRKTYLTKVGPIYRIFVGGYDSTAELKEALALAEKN